VPRLLLTYHFFHPDDVAGARQFAELAEEQVRRGWDVTVVTSNRSWRDPTVRYPAHERWNGVEIHRVFRPPWEQARPLGRLGNSAWLIPGFFLRALRLGRFDAIVIGSDPAFAPLMALGLRAAFPSTPIVHWCFDLYPEAIAAEGSGRARALAVGAARALMRLAYRRHDQLVDLGPAMGRRLARYEAGPAQETLVPWAHAEPGRAAPADPEARAALFPRARLGLLYSGTLGRAHDYASFLALARACRARSGDAIGVCFSARGHRAEELRRAVGPDDTNVSFAPFADAGALEGRLQAADLHLLSLKPEWAGIVVPSKFFGSLAVGRPVIYAGPADSEIAGWIAAHDVGLHLTPDSLASVVDRLHALLADPQALAAWQAHAVAAYERQFSKRVVNDRWDALLRGLVARRRTGSSTGS
jgi:colanic acid biosynthesis glycosyl transferase WcaI